MKRNLVFLSVLVLLCRESPAIINPNFTPKELVEQSELIVVGALRATGSSGEWKLSVARLLKGKATKEQLVSLAGCSKDHAGDIREALKKNGSRPVILFVGTMQEVKAAYMHVGGSWLGVKAGGANRWNISGYAPKLGATFAGGTDMLIRMSEYVIKHPDPSVPVSAGVRWADDRLKVGNIAGKTGGMATIEIGRKRETHLFVSCSAGDRLFRPKTVDLETSFTDVTAASGLDSKSSRFAWVDVNRDGLSDLVSWNGAALSVRFAAADGKFKAAGPRWSVKLESGCTAVAPCSTDGRPAVLLSTYAAPELLVANGNAGWTKAALPGGNKAMDMGDTSPCIVADFDLDGYPDVLRPGAESSTLWRGRAGGFRAPAQTTVRTSGGSARAAVGDFNEDGSLDILLAAPRANSLWENIGTGRFTNVFPYSGSMSYKCPKDPAEVLVMDLNHDGRSDLCFVYPRQGIVYHFNRGFRAFGEEGEVRLSGLNVEVGRPPIGIRAMSVGDYDACSSQDLIVLLTTGEIQAYLNDQMDMPGLRLRLPKGMTGPLTVSCWQGKQFPVCTGTAVVTGHSPAAYVAARSAGAVTIKWVVPGGGIRTKAVVVEDRSVDVIIEPKRRTRPRP